ncbi:pituitary tumor-transforming gene 1 protein-interacting protein-like isoform X2 [Protopterus annectens]|uniref:pituitary tumor-transforming gene 1 protein-interacting protein-like isoform X2 n=1 Tax=Protopterus annectens TaxID=7888 RepID=UPI001CF9F9D5|nr:pituitary tumor-transforming gene 1 protein-interacting protein-like isoform X2 [Protopterus annectens]
MNIVYSDANMFDKIEQSVIILLSVCCLGQLTTTTSPLTTSVQPSGECFQFSGTSCEDCLRNVSCLWCNADKKCINYPVKKLLPPSSLCALSEARWGVCWVNFQALIIALAIIAGLLLIMIFVCCCYCCWCRRRYRRQELEEEERLTREREERKQRAEERSAERRIRHNEIRKKYGLLTDNDSPYSRYENE